MDTKIKPFLDFLCRTCMRELAEISSGQQWQSIFDTIGLSTDLPISEMISIAIPQIEVHPSDQLPKNICRKCLEQLQCIYRFQEMCVESQQQMRQLIAIADSDITIATDTSVEHVIINKDSQQNQHSEDVKDQIIEFASGNTLTDSQQNQHSEDVKDQIIEFASGNTLTNSQQNQNSEDVKDQIIEFAAENILTEATQLGIVDPLQCIDELNVENYTVAKTEATVEVSDGVSQLSSVTVQTEAIAVDIEKELRLPSSTNICPICNKSFKQRRLLQYHLKRHKKDNIPRKKFEYFRYECNMCDRFFYKPESLHKHRLEHDSEGGIRTYICKVCNKSLSSAHTLWRHKKNQHSVKIDVEKKHICEFCNKSFTLSASLKTHVRTHTGERPYLCPECGKSFSTSGQMKQHRLRHDAVKRFECPHCPMKFSCSSDLSKHKLVHDEVKRHACDICGDRFAKAHELKTHKMYHNGVKPYKCTYCDKRFVVGDAWRRHTRTHTGEKPYKCKYCDSAFAQSGDLIKHLRLHIGDNVYRCDLCPAAFRMATEKRLHFATHKNDDEETRERNKKALMDEEAKLVLKFSGRAHRLVLEQSLREVETNKTD